VHWIPQGFGVVQPYKPVGYVDRSVIDSMDADNLQMKSCIAFALAEIFVSYSEQIDRLAPAVAYVLLG